MAKYKVMVRCWSSDWYYYQAGENSGEIHDTRQAAVEEMKEAIRTDDSKYHEFYVAEVEDD